MTRQRLEVNLDYHLTPYDGGGDGRPRCCVVFTTDETYLYPTLVSAMQARGHISAGKADVLICHFGISEAARLVFAGACAAEGIDLLAVDPAAIEGATPMLSRLFLDRFLPAVYDQILYLDGDVQISRSLDPLIEVAVPDGRFLAANDPMTFLLADRGPLSVDLSHHLASIGLGAAEAANYFNTGVLRINRTGWAETGARAWDLARRGIGGGRFSDQDPLNVVAAATHLPLSLGWNFPIFLRNARIADEINPAVTHFMSNPKPWQGAYPPWTRQDCQPYDLVVARYPGLAPYRRRLTMRRRAHYRLLQTYKKLTETLTWGFGARRDRIRAYERRAQLAWRTMAALAS